MAGEEGFEPSNGGSKVRCLTTWRLPKVRLSCPIGTSKNTPHSVLERGSLTAAALSKRLRHNCPKVQ